jgi:tetratricopeptide (TPR) repeat protein
LLFARTVHPQAATPADFGTDLHGQPIHHLAGPGVRVVVLIFAASDCPISNRYVPEIARLTNEFSPQGVRFWWVYPNGADTASVIDLDPQDADGWNNLGALLARGGQTAAARSAFEHALQIQPDHAQAKANLARLSVSH